MIKFLSVLTAIFMTGIAESASPPWYYNQSLVRHTVGADPCVTVEELVFPDSARPLSVSNPIVLPLTVCDAEKARLLAVFVKPMLGEFLKIEIRTEEVIPDTSVEWTFSELKEKFERTFGSNPYFVALGSGMFGPTPIFRPEVVQFFCDNIAVPSGYCHFLAADAFEGVLKEDVGGHHLIMTTALKE